MYAQPFLAVLTSVLLYPAPRDPEPDDKGVGFLGVQLVDNGGVIVMSVEPGSPADKAGLRSKDRILAIDEHPIPTVNDARELIARLRPGQPTFVEIRRGEKALALKVKMGVRPKELP